MMNRKTEATGEDIVGSSIAFFRNRFCLFVVLLGMTFVPFYSPFANVAAEEDSPPTATKPDIDEGEATSTKRKPAEKEPPDLRKVISPELKLKSLTEQGGVWVDTEQQRVVLHGEVVLREGFLELFACPEGTKEHESVIAVKCKSFEVHTALLAAGLVPGKPVQFRPVYEVATGPLIQVRVVWESNDKKLRVSRAQEWIRNAKTGTEMEQGWVFAGSRFWTDEQTGEEYYYADGGELICLSNFTTAMLDLPIESPQENTALMFEAFTERIPPIGTKVYVVLEAAEVKHAK
jgi:hypothetical protein